MEKNKIEIRTVSVKGTGIVFADYDRATFTVSTKSRGKTTSACRKLIDAPVANFVNYVKELGSIVDENSFSSASAVHPVINYYDNRKRTQDGYEMVYNASFTINDLSKTNEILDKLSALDNFTVGVVHYSIHDMEQLKDKAMEIAFQNAKKNFIKQLSFTRPIDDVNRDWTISSWSVLEDIDDVLSPRSVGSLSAQNSFDAELSKEKKASVEVNVKVIFEKLLKLFK